MSTRNNHPVAVVFKPGAPHRQTGRARCSAQRLRKSRMRLNGLTVAAVGPIIVASLRVIGGGIVIGCCAVLLCIVVGLSGVARRVPCIGRLVCTRATHTHTKITPTFSIRPKRQHFLSFRAPREQRQNREQNYAGSSSQTLTCSLACTAGSGHTPWAACNFAPHSFAYSRWHCSRTASAVVGHSFACSPFAGCSGRIRCHFVAFAARNSKIGHQNGVSQVSESLYAEHCRQASAKRLSTWL